MHVRGVTDIKKGAQSKMAGRIRSHLFLRKPAVVLGLLTALTALACAPMGGGDLYDHEARRFRSEKNHCELTLPSGDQWQGRAARDISTGIIFEASNPSKLLYLFFAAETLNSDLEDYYLLLKVSNRLEEKPSYEFFGQSTESIQGVRALRFVYAADVDDAGIGRQRFVYVNVLYKKGKRNYRLIVYTLQEAYDRRKDLIEQVIKGVRFL